LKKGDGGASGLLLLPAAGGLEVRCELDVSSGGRRKKKEEIRKRTYEEYL
jgi:hypothetical protein